MRMTDALFSDTMRIAPEGVSCANDGRRRGNVTLHAVIVGVDNDMICYIIVLANDHVFAGAVLFASAALALRGRNSATEARRRPALTGVCIRIDDRRLWWNIRHVRDDLAETDFVI